MPQKLTDYMREHGLDEVTVNFGYGDQLVSLRPAVHEMRAKMSEPTTVITGTTTITELVVPDADGTVRFRTGYTYSGDLNDWMAGEWDKLQVTPIPAGDAKPVWPPFNPCPHCGVIDGHAHADDCPVAVMVLGGPTTPGSIPCPPEAAEALHRAHKRSVKVVNNGYTQIDTEPEKPLTDAQRALGRAVNADWRNR